MEVTGLIHKALGERTGEGQNGSWRIASYVIDIGHFRPQFMTFDVFDGQDHRIDRLNIQEGKRMRVFFDIDAREYNGKWFNSIRAFDARLADEPDAPTTEEATAAI